MGCECIQGDLCLDQSTSGYGGGFIWRIQAGIIAGCGLQLPELVNMEQLSHQVLQEGYAHIVIKKIL